jgi:hypothetical protein
MGSPTTTAEGTLEQSERLIRVPLDRLILQSMPYIGRAGKKFRPSPPFDQTLPHAIPLPQLYLSISCKAARQVQNRLS